MDCLTDTRIRQVGERVEIVHHRRGKAPVTLSFGLSEAESVAQALAANAAEARAAQRAARFAVEPAE